MPIGFNLQVPTYYSPCIFNDQTKVASVTGRVLLISAAADEREYTALVSPDVTSLTIPSTGATFPTVDGKVVFKVTARVGKGTQLNFNTRDAANMKVQVVRTDWLPNFYAGETFTPAAIKFHSTSSITRFMDVAHTNSADFQTWTPANTTNLSGLPWPIEVMAEFCNKTRTHAWLPLHYKLPMAEMVRVVEQFRSLLDPALKLYIEWSNEVWNTGRGFLCGRWLNENKMNGAKWYGEQSAALGAATAHIGGTQLIMAWQRGTSGIGKVLASYKAATGNDMSRVAAIAFAPYIGLPGKDAAGVKIDWSARSDDDLVEALVAHQITDEHYFAEHAALAKANGVSSFLYEFGFEMGAGSGATDAEDARRQRLSLDPRLGEAQAKHLAAFQAASPDGYACAFNDVGYRTIYGHAADYDDLVGSPRLQAITAMNEAARVDTFEAGVLAEVARIRADLDALTARLAA